jgi:hypothetical protein
LNRLRLRPRTEATSKAKEANKMYLLVVGWLIAFELMILGIFYLYLRSQVRIDRRILFPVMCVLVAAVFSSALFLSGVILLVQLATFAGILGLWVYFTLRRRPMQKN